VTEADVLIIGGGPAGAACAETLRAEGFEGSVLLCGRDPDPPYERPVVSKQRLRGESCDPWLAAPENVDCRTRTSVMKLDTDARVATLSTKETVEYGSALIATGANVRVDGATLEGIHYLRALGNADGLRADAEGAERVVLIGGSYIACEVAASLTEMGKRCTLVAMEPSPLCTGFGDAVGEWVAGVLRDHGVELAMGETLAGFEGSGDRVERVRCESGAAFDCDLVVMGTGAMPDVMLARSAGLELGETGGVRCDAALRTSADGVWAAGDVCEYESALHGRRLRVEHFEVARSQGAFVARAMLGADNHYDEIPYFWTDLADWLTLEYVGPAPSWEREVVRGTIGDAEFSVFYLDAGGRVLGALTRGRGEDLDLARELIRSGAPLPD
jgi:3-phenylpropionate/trans-cinnamate dioxygenase ferredoxin reductase component